VTTSNVQNPLQYAASITADFVRQAALQFGPQVGGRITALDVGCGEGLIAADLSRQGFTIIGIDGHGESVAKARQIGVDARETLLADFQHAPFKLIYVSRALHHMPPLAETLAKLNSLLSDDGIMVIDEFCRELFQMPESTWLFECVQKIRAKSSDTDPINAKQDNPRHNWLLTSKSAEEVLHNWHNHHDHKHKLLTGNEMKEGLEQVFSIKSMESFPSLFRYLCDFLPATADGASDAAAFQQNEVDQIKADQLTAIGLRIVLSKRTE